jgi:hypothetical protein
MVDEAQGSQLRIFLSYAHQDRETVELLHDKLTIAHHDVWFDEELRGGQQWWDAILTRIADSHLILFVASPDSFRSKACGLEVAYAAATNRRIVPIEVRDIEVLDGPDAIQSVQVESFVDPTDDDWIRLIADIVEMPRSGSLPDPMPEHPPAPIVDLTSARSIVAQSTISGDEQRSLLADLKVRVPNADETDAVVAVLERLRAYPNIVEGVADEIDDLLRQYRTSHLDARSAELIDTVVTAMQAHECTPIVGTGMGDWLFGSRRDHAQAWAKSFGFPLERHRHSDLPQVAQFVAVQKKPRQLRSELATFYREQLQERFPGVLGGDAPPKTLNDMVLAVWKDASESFAMEPHTVLAQMPCKVYVTAQPTSLLTEALKGHGKDPVVDFCRWNPDLDADEWPESPLAQDKDYVPSIERPLVFHILGTIEYPDSIVIAEDEYFEFLAEVARDRNLIPGPVREALADSTLLFLGFGLGDWDVRVLMRSLISPQSARRLGKFQHVAAQVDVEVGSARVDARRYMETYFQRFREPSIDIFWSSVEEFSRQLALQWEESE